MQFSLFQKIRQKVEQIVSGRGAVDEDLFDELEIMLIQSDINVKTTARLLNVLRDAVQQQGLQTVNQVVARLKDELILILSQGKSSDTAKLNKGTASPHLYILVGVNGVGKTTSAARIAHMLQSQGERVVLAAGDTFRAAAIDQLMIWAERTGTEIVRHREGGDPSAVVYDAIRAACARGATFVVADTAGRLHNRTNLMEELKKIHRISERELGRAADEILLVLDATTGQNAISQAKLFMEAIPITGIVLTKLDSTARGGVVITIADELKLPIKLVGTGEGMKDLSLFNAKKFVDSLLAD